MSEKIDIQNGSQGSAVCGGVGFILNLSFYAGRTLHNIEESCHGTHNLPVVLCIVPNWKIHFDFWRPTTKSKFDVIENACCAMV